MANKLHNRLTVRKTPAFGAVPASSLHLQDEISSLKCCEPTSCDVEGEVGVSVTIKVTADREHSSVKSVAKFAGNARERTRADKQKRLVAFENAVGVDR